MPGTLGIHHVGIAVRDLDEAVTRYGTLVGGTVDHEAVVPEQGVHAVALRVGDGPLIELLAPTGEDTPVGRFLAKRGEGFHHLSIDVDALDPVLERMEADGIRIVDRADLGNGYRTAFVSPRSAHGVLIQFWQVPSLESPSW